MTQRRDPRGTDVRLVLIVPYFGRLPSTFPLWLESCRLNPSIDWVLITDDAVPAGLPLNVRVYRRSFADIQRQIAAAFDHPISLEHPYKLCDYRPTYGHVFAEYLEDYDFWGYCDVDTIWGNLRSVLTGDVLRLHDKVFAGGHFTLLRNREDVNSLYKRARSDAWSAYARAFQRPGSYAFDEWGLNDDGFNALLTRAGYSLYTATMPYADIKPHTYGLRTTREEFGDVVAQVEERKKRNIVYVWDRGKLSQYFLDASGEVGQREEAYIHLQKRPIVDLTGGVSDRYMISPPGRIRHAPVAIDADHLRLVAAERHFYPHYYRLRLGSLRRRVSALGKRL